MPIAVVAVQKSVTALLSKCCKIPLGTRICGQNSNTLTDIQSVDCLFRFQQWHRAIQALGVNLYGGLNMVSHGWSFWAKSLGFCAHA